MKYDKKIKYLDYKENGERVRSGGFVKLELWGGTCNIFIQVSGLYAIDSYVRQVYIIAGGREEKLETIELKQGRGSLQLSCSGNDLCRGLGYEQLEAISIPITPGRELYCRIAERTPEEEKLPPGVQPESRGQETADAPETSPRMEEPETERSREEEAEAERCSPEKSGEAASGAEEAGEERRTREGLQYWEGSQRASQEYPFQVSSQQASQNHPTQENSQNQAQAKHRELVQEQPKNMARQVHGGGRAELETEDRQTESKAEGQRRRVPLQEDKWKQLQAVYPHIAPFQDEREYLSIGPEDFVIFSQKYYGLVNNSFLLHGYYNYRHLILTCMERRKETCYYIGVPGNFYDREKQVALMFGFESFECREEPAGVGDYGYYMMRVEI